jgi:dATP pyrophosphohydrolase
VALRRPESVLVVVYTAAAEVLLLKRVAPFSFWQSVTGSLDLGESPAETARRELEEETGLGARGTLIDTGVARTFTIDPRWLDRYSPGVTENREYEWRFRLPEMAMANIDVDEHSEYRWVSIDEAVDLVWSWTNRQALESLRFELRAQRQPV